MQQPAGPRCDPSTPAVPALQLCWRVASVDTSTTGAVASSLGLARRRVSLTRGWCTKKIFFVHYPLPSLSTGSRSPRPDWPLSECALPSGPDRNVLPADSRNHVHMHGRFRLSRRDHSRFLEGRAARGREMEGRRRDILDILTRPHDLTKWW